MSTIKDRGRAMWTDDVFQDFAIDYLVNTAGWEVKKSFVKVGTDNAGDDGQADA
jgi:hypothetical protein